jgi:hypothetical protein
MYSGCLKIWYRLSIKHQLTKALMAYSGRPWPAMVNNHMGTWKKSIDLIYVVSDQILRTWTWIVEQKKKAPVYLIDLICLGLTETCFSVVINSWVFNNDLTFQKRIKEVKCSPTRISLSQRIHGRGEASLGVVFQMLQAPGCVASLEASYAMEPNFDSTVIVRKIAGCIIGWFKHQRRCAPCR